MEMKKIKIKGNATLLLLCIAKLAYDKEPTIRKKYR